MKDIILKEIKKLQKKGKLRQVSLLSRYLRIKYRLYLPDECLFKRIKKANKEQKSV